MATLLDESVVASAVEVVDALMALVVSETMAGDSAESYHMTANLALVENAIIASLLKVLTIYKRGESPNPDRGVLVALDAQRGTLNATAPDRGMLLP